MVEILEHRRLERAVPPLVALANEAPGFPPGAFTGDLAGFLQFAANDDGFRTQTMWCGRHWAPCPVENKDGRVASLALMQLAVEQLIPRNLVAINARRRWLGRQTTPICCQLGGELVTMLWSSLSLNGEK